MNPPLPCHHKLLVTTYVIRVFLDMAFYLEFVEILLELAEGFLERVDRRTGARASLSGENDLFLVDQGTQANLELGLFLQVEGVDLDWGDISVQLGHFFSFLFFCSYGVGFFFGFLATIELGTLGCVEKWVDTFSSSRSSLKKKAAFCDWRNFEYSSSRTTGVEPGGGEAAMVTEVWAFS